MIEPGSTIASKKTDRRASTAAETKPRLRRRQGGVVRDPFAAFAERWRRGGGKTVLGVCGCQRNCGGTVVATSIAVSSASVLDQRTLLIDANLYHPALHRSFCLEAEPGLSEAMAMRVEPEECIQVSRVPRLSILTAGAVRCARWSDFNLETFTSLMTELQTEFDMIVVDLPSADTMAECVSLAAATEEVLLVVESERTSGRAACRAHHQLVRSGANVVGTVLNKTRTYVPSWLDRWL